MMEVNIQKRLDGAEGAIQLDLQISLKKGGIIGIMGRSGEGKSSLLRMLAGLLQPDSGEILFENDYWYSSERNIYKSPQHRRVGLVFQDYALFPNMTVLENLLFPSGKKGKKEALEMLETMGISELANRKPLVLSGGQQQRVALARALMYRPQLLMLDEAMAAVDDVMRERVQDFILEYQGQHQPSIIVVSHRYSELEKMADEVYEMVDGKLQRVAPFHSLKMSLEFLGIRGDNALVRDVSGKVSEIPLNWVKGKKPGDRFYLRIGDIS